MCHWPLYYLCVKINEWPPLQFQANDILGLYHPFYNVTQVCVWYEVGTGPWNYVHVNQSSPLTSGFTTGEGFDNNLPLVAVEVNGKSSQGTACYSMLLL